MEGEGEGEARDFPTISADYDFFRTYEVPIIAGRDFIEGRDPPSPLHEEGFQGSVSQSSAIVTEAAARELGFARPEDAIGAGISTTSRSNSATHVFTIVGVAGDSQFYSPRREPRPEVYVISRAQGSLIDALAVRVQGEPGRMLAGLEEVSRSVAGDVPLRASVMDQLMALEYAQERSEAKLLLGFSLLAIAIACLGLFGSASFNVERRTKEIGIRKVMGAEVREIVRLLLWQFSRPVLLANLIAWPIALWAMLNWLQRFTYRIDVWTLGPICLVAGLIALCIAWATVGGTALRSASAKPVLALRYE